VRHPVAMHAFVQEGRPFPHSAPVSATCVRVRVYICVYVCVCVNVCIYVCARVCVCMCVSEAWPTMCKQIVISVLESYMPYVCEMH
jgi:hypothetical protein